MDWVVDTCVLLDILDEIPPFAEAAAEALDEKVEEGELTVAPITYVELAPAFNGDRAMHFYALDSCRPSSGETGRAA